MPDEWYPKASKCSEDECKMKILIKDMSKVNDKLIAGNAELKRLKKMFNKIKSKSKLDHDDYKVYTVEDESHPCYGVEMMKLEMCDPSSPSCNGS